MALASEAALTALGAYFVSGGDSRGARVLCDSGGAATPQTRLGPLADARFAPERRGTGLRRDSDATAQPIAHSNVWLAGSSLAHAAAQHPIGIALTRRNRVEPQMFPDHIEEAIASIRGLYTEHHERSTAQQRAMASVTAIVGRPIFLGFLGAAVGLWIVVNLLMTKGGYDAFDMPPFPWLQGAITLLSLAMLTFVLGAQRHEDELAERRDTLTLELALLNEQKTAKMIQLLEEFRRDSPQLVDRRDPQAEVMAQPVDPQSVLNAVHEAPLDAKKPPT